MRRPGRRALAALGFAVIAIVALLLLLWPRRAVPDLDDPGRIAAGRSIYAQHCASCHGANLEGQANWRTPLASGRMPAPPHDDSGHTWHHPSEVLFAVTKHGLKPPVAPAGYASDMPGFAGTLGDDQIWNVLAFIRSRWSAQVRARHAELDRHHAAQPR